ncbi:hypothetical protein EV368DRAFT_7152, partial [Lentinula lateritia]
TEPLELVHTDTCSPIGTLSNHQSSHFNIILNNYISALSGGCFAKKNQALCIIKSMISTWENIMSPHKVKNIQLDGGKE